MILHRTDDTQAFVPASGNAMGQRITAVTFTASDIRDIMCLEPEDLKAWLASSLMPRFAPYDYWEDRDGQRQATREHNRRLKGSEAIDDRHPARFSARDNE